MTTFHVWRSWIFDSWGYVDFYTYFTLNDNADIGSIMTKIPEFEETQTGNTKKEFRYDIDIEPMAAAYIHSKAGRQPGEIGNMTNLYIFSLIGLFVLVIACINFINLSTARSIERAKEVGLRKMVGARKRSLVFQFLSEFFLLSLFAGLLAVGIVILLSPSLQNLTGKPITYHPLFTWEFAVLFLGSIAIIGILAGSYPAFLLSRFQPIKVLKGNFKPSFGGITLRKGLVTFQFMLTIVLLVGTATIFYQLKYLQNHNLGFDKEHMLIVDFGWDPEVSNKIEVIKDELSSCPDVLSINASRAVPGDFFPNAGTVIEGPEGTMVHHGPGIYEIDPDFITSYNMTMAAGRSFSHEYASDSMEALIINEAAARLWGYNNPADVVGKKFEQWGKSGKIIGVIKDFNYQSLHKNVEPLSLRYDPNSMSKISIRIKSTDIPKTIIALEGKWKKLVPHRPFNYTFLDDSFNKQYLSDDRFSKMFSAFALLAIFIACLGLFGLTTYTTTQRTKEIGIRKVLGASVSRIVILLSQDFTRLLVFAFIVAVPVSWYAIQHWLDNYAYKATIGAEVYILATVPVVIIALATVSWQSIKAAFQNPVDSLRNE